MRLFLCSTLMLALLGPALIAQPKSPPANPAPPPAEPALDLDALMEQGKELFDEFAPPEVKEHFEFPRREQWNEFARRFQRALESNDLDALASYAPEARAALTALRAFPGYDVYADWLAERLDYAEVAEQARQVPAPRPVPRSVRGHIPHYELWLARMKTRPVPARAAELLPRVRAVFAAEGVPADLAWLAEAESTFNPAALSPVGAKGLFQLMPATARELGLSTMLPDERGDAEKNARAAARYLKQLHARFGDWPLVLAAYNAGPGRVRRTLNQRQAKTFSEIAAALPAETRMYVPKVLATLAVRAGVGLEELPPPK
ncbi:MAG: lytic transglycosylase [Opitutus sp.]|nr:lytic transglycosylase [Opitutus sp.]